MATPELQAKKAATDKHGAAYKEKYDQTVSIIRDVGVHVSTLLEAFGVTAPVRVHVPSPSHRYVLVAP